MMILDPFIVRRGSWLKIGLSLILSISLTAKAANPHPADINQDFKIDIGEVTSYGACWKAGCVTANAPLPIPINYVTNAGSIWQAGETYHYDSTQICPQCWASGPDPIVPGQFQWVKSAVVSNTGNPKGIAIDRDGNVVAVGTFGNDVDFGSGLGLLPYVGGKDNFIVKYDMHGNVLWAKSFGNKVDDDIRGVAIDGADNIIVIGSFNATVDFGGAVLTPTGSVTYPSATLTATYSSLGNYIPDIFVAKYNSSGAIVWVKQFGGTGYDYGMALAVDKSNDNIFIGAQVNSASSVFGAFTLINPPNGPAVFAQLHGDGSVVWAKGWAISEIGAPHIAVDKFGDLVVAGSFVGTANFGSSPKTSIGYDIFLAKYSGVDGTWKWDKTMGGTAYDYCYGMATDPLTGNVIITGLFGSSMDFAGGPITDYFGHAGLGGIYLAAYDSSGNYLWAKTPDSSFNAQDNGNGVVVDDHGDIYCTGSANSPIYFGGSQALTGVGDYWVASVTSAGSYRWSKRAKSANSGGGPIAVDSFGHLLVAGGIQSGLVYFDGLLGAAGGSATTGVGLTAPFVIQYSK